MKTKYTLYCALIILASLSAPISAEYNIAGDVNADGRITTADSLLALQMAVGSVAPDLERADVNADGGVSSLDALMILMMAEKTQVCVNAPEVVSGAFEVTIDVHNVADLDSGQFDLSFDPGVVNVTAVHCGRIGCTDVPIESWAFVDADTIRVLFDLLGVTGVSGSGHIATISFEVTGSPGDSCVLGISDVGLVDTRAEEMPAIWNDCEVTIGEDTPLNRVHNINTGEIFSSIKDAINDHDTSDGDVIEVGDGVYHENVKVTKSLTIRSENGPSNCVIQAARRNRHVVEVTVDYVSISGFTIMGLPESSFSRTGIYITASYCNVSNNNCSNNGYGIHLDGSNNNHISSNDCSNNRGDGIRLDGSNNNHISSNNCLDNWVGIHIDDSSNNSIAGNDCSNNRDDGIYLSGSSNNKLTGNIMFENGIRIRGNSLSDYTHVIDETNTVNGNPVYYWKDIEYGRIPGGAGQVILVNCKGVLVEDQELNNVNVGVEVVFSTNVTIRNNTFSNNSRYGIGLDDSSNNSISSNNCLNNRAGIFLDGSSNNSILDNTCSNNDVGISLSHSSNNSISDNTCSNNEQAGIYISESSNNIISGNTCSNNEYGIYIYDSSNNIISGNTCSNNDVGIYLGYSSNNRLTGNGMFENGISIRGNSLSDYTHEIDESNMVNGKPVYYWKDIESGRIPGGAGQVILVNCNDVLVEDQELNNANVGVEAVFSSNVTIRNNTCSNNDVGIYLGDSSNNSISDNTFSNNSRYGIRLDDSSNNSISDNTCSNNERAGIYLGYSSNNRLTGNTCSNNDVGIYLGYSSNNKLTGNSMFENGISIRGKSLSDYTHEIDESNMVNGKPVYYWKDIKSERIPGGAGQVILVNCKDVLVEDQELNNANVGVEAVFSSNVTIRNNNCSNNDVGIYLGDSSNNSISDNTCSNNELAGICLDDSSNNSISDNTCSNNDVGIYLGGSSNNSISDNTCSNNMGDGIRLSGSINSKLTGNSMFENGISIRGKPLSDYTHEIDESNTVNGKPVYYWLDIEYGRIPEGAGQVILVNCNDVLVEDQELNNASIGIEVAFSSHIAIRTNNCSNNRDAGIHLYESRETALYLNSFMNNAGDIKISSCPSANNWNSTLKIDYTYKGTTFSNYLGNYWDDYEGSDSDGDGVGDTPYDINSGKDNHPLMVPFENCSAVTVDAHGIVSGAFNATINVHHIGDLDSGQFDLTFDPNIMNVTGVDAGTIDNTTVQVNWCFMDADTIRVLFELSDETGVNGSGYVARVDFAMVGPLGCVSVLDISNGKLVDTGGSEIPALWIDKEVIIAVPVTVNAPPVVTDTFEVTIDVENVTCLDSGQFEFSFDPSVVTVEDVRAGSVGNTEIPIMWSFRNADTIIVLFNIPGIRGVSGSGCVARINFELTGSPGDASVLDISNGLLVNNNADKIPAIWNDCEVTIGEYTPLNQVHNLNTGENFSSIQAAIDDPDTLDGHTIEVEDGVYHEHVRVTKSLTIRSLNGSANCVIQDAGGNRVVEITVDHVSISGFTVKGLTESTFGEVGIYLDASYCNVSDNKCSNNWAGIHLFWSSTNNSISNNDCSNNFYDICLDGSSNNKLTGNTMFESGIFIQGNSLVDYTHEIDESNTVNGKPVYYWKDIESRRIPDGAGQVILVNCTDVLVEDQELNNVSAGVEVVFSSNNTIRNNICSNIIRYGIRLYESSNNRISSNNCSNNMRDGVFLVGSSNNYISSNDCSNNMRDGVLLVGSSNNYISSNDCSNNNGYGICLSGSSNNRLSSNDCSDNGIGIHFCYSKNNSISSNDCSDNCAGIFIDGSDNNSILRNNCSNNWRTGIYFFQSRSNVIYLNNFINESNNIDSESSSNIWNSILEINYTYDGKTFTNYLGNYWDDHSGTDSNNDGIGDTPHIVDGENDNYPLVMPIENYFVET